MWQLETMQNLSQTIFLLGARPNWFRSIPFRLLTLPRLALCRWSGGGFAQLHFSTLRTSPSFRSQKYCVPMEISYFFCLPRLWNSLPIIDHTQSLTVIKQKLKNFLWNHFLANFDNSLCCFHYPCPCSRCSKNPASNNFNHL